jgi:hypothetical protein
MPYKPLSVAPWLSHPHPLHILSVRILTMHPLVVVTWILFVSSRFAIAGNWPSPSKKIYGVNLGSWYGFNRFSTHSPCSYTRFQAHNRALDASSRYIKLFMREPLTTSSNGFQSGLTWVVTCAMIARTVLCRNCVLVSPLGQAQLTQLCLAPLSKSTGTTRLIRSSRDIGMTKFVSCREARWI